jgi:hypothetical protein
MREDVSYSMWVVREFFEVYISIITAVILFLPVDQASNASYDSSEGLLPATRREITNRGLPWAFSDIYKPVSALRDLGAFWNARGFCARRGLSDPHGSELRGKTCPLRFRLPLSVRLFCRFEAARSFPGSINFIGCPI